MDAQRGASFSAALSRERRMKRADNVRDAGLSSGAVSGSQEGSSGNASGKVFTRLFKSAGIAPPKSGQTRIPRFGSQTDLEQESSSLDPRSPGPPSAPALSPSSTAGSTLSMIRALDNGTPSRLARFRAKNWMKDVGKKRALEAVDGAMSPPAKRKAVTSLFPDEPSGRSGWSEEVNQGKHEEEVERERLSDSATIISFGGPSSSLSTSQPPPQPDAVGTFEDIELRLQQEIKVGLGLKQDLSRDNARMKLKMDSLRDDIDYYYELLARIEAVALHAKSQAVAAPSGDESASNAASVVKLAEEIQRVISAPKSGQRLN
ncbi:hypothetical protein FI667_g9609, partial [Globisporangium splendens]